MRRWTKQRVRLAAEACQFGSAAIHRLAQNVQPSAEDRLLKPSVRFQFQWHHLLHVPASKRIAPCGRQRQRRQQFICLTLAAQTGAFKVEAMALQLLKQRLDPPAPPVKIKACLWLNAVAHQNYILISRQADAADQQFYTANLSPSQNLLLSNLEVAEAVTDIDAPSAGGGHGKVVTNAQNKGESCASSAS